MHLLARLAASCAAAIACSAAAATGSSSQFVVFGDSLSDPGNAQAITSGAFPPSPPYAGTFSNGPTAAQYLAQSLGVTVVPGWPASTAASNNFAVGGGLNGTGNYNVQIGNPPGLGAAFPQMASTGIGQQIDRYAAQHPAVPDPAGTLFMVWGGPNDLFLALETPGADVPAAINQAVVDLAGDVTRLALMGADHILVPSMPDLGKTPEALGQGDAIAGLISQVSAGYNQGLSFALGQLRPALAPLGVSLYGFDTAALFASVTADPPRYGFTNTTGACFDRRVNPPDLSAVLAGCPGYLYFDLVHPTTAAHHLLAQGFAQAVPEPQSVLLMLLGLLAVGRAARRGVRR